MTVEKLEALVAKKLQLKEKNNVKLDKVEKKYTLLRAKCQWYAIAIDKLNKKIERKKGKISL